MNPIFKHGPSPQHRLVLVLFCSALLVFFDHKMASFESLRGYLQSMISPLQYIANTPKVAMTWISTNVTTRQQLMNENRYFRLNELVFHEQAMQLDILKQENERLRTLLASPLRSELKKMVAEILSVDSDPYSHQLVINRGARDGVYEGQPVLDALGIVGQILHVGQTTSRIILITDTSHAVPVRVKRNGLRLLASGSGQIDRLNLNFVPQSADVQVGDVLVTSGLGGKYPEGYPVATISYISNDESREFLRVYSTPIAQIDRLRYLLLLSDEDPINIFAPKTETEAVK
ncbi:rod shape-determining protein MreC [Colwellia sp. 4_MG-2023]|jgi:rod shape-determining protein MreC|uniref:rod shape-determining protein MreC n=1 Tax=unclassified Colwellia TaxID=196834 RepID=UPI001C0A3995|nr:MULTISPECIES: rod shape-determining protein MreC [unclassified Colwellia]MBU2924998.1 rod shape-determining protein MreC [Colwellia sp. C2M11]MDO6486403.1 rod shape-determining protein MreC [Colwellia sp. 6_MG-2023]MDO6506281.1 rod shape-determining protein MreC [Colwellia sp. 5_MG-2023]MDO6557361.1 rod shape-determining protein MreC [Colwellia sp. 4_MG-2023]MDO6651709.1 rod shape-determining protein MreC [Colwellia sp. 3_MG-2023]